MEDELDAVKRLRAGVFGRGARDYDRVGTPIFGRLGRRLVELAAVQADDHVLDVATGRGAVLFAAAELVGERGRVIGVDLAEEMVALTSADIRARRITNAEVRVADAERLSEFVDCCASTIQRYGGDGWLRAAVERRSSPSIPSENPVSGSRLRTDSRRVRGGCAELDEEALLAVAEKPPV
jgi:SAM-dependent methyltransferase